MKYCPTCCSLLENKLIDGLERVACSSQTCNYIFFNNPTPVVAAVVEYNNQIILAHNKEWPEDWFGLITGFLEKGETPENAILREVNEELGLKGRIVEFIGNYSFFKANQIILAFHVKAEGKVILNEELDDLKYLSPEEIVPWDFGTGPALKDWLDKKKRNA